MSNSKFHFRILTIFILFLSIVFTSACKKSEDLITVATEPEANEIVSILEENKIEAHKEAVGEERDRKWKIIVTESSFSSGKAIQARQLLQDNGLPHPIGIGLGEEPASGLGLSPMGEENKKTKQLEVEVERQLRVIPGVVRVDVNLVLPQEDTLKLTPYPARASVLIVHRNKETLFTTAQVQGLVSGSVPNLLPENVTVGTYYQAPRVLPPVESVNPRTYKIIIIAAVFVLVLITLILVLFFAKRKQNKSQSTSTELATEEQIENF